MNLFSRNDTICLQLKPRVHKKDIDIWFKVWYNIYIKRESERPQKEKELKQNSQKVHKKPLDKSLKL